MFLTLPSCIHNKVSYPAEFHAQTAVECGVILHPKLKDRVKDIKEIIITTHESAIRIIDKKGPLKHVLFRTLFLLKDLTLSLFRNPADRDHCIQFMTSCALLFGNLTAEMYEDEFVHKHPEIDQLREKMVCVEKEQYSKDYHDPEKRSIANTVQVLFVISSKSPSISSKSPFISS